LYVIKVIFPVFTDSTSDENSAPTVPV
jgi:hypothetical protein